MWERFCATPLGELITGTAYQTHPTDMTAPLSVRFSGQTILALHIALERAATVRVSFGPGGEARLSGIRHIRQRATSELGEVLRAEATASGASWVVVVFATGWQAVLGPRAARPDPADRASDYARHRLMFETPEAVIPRAQVDRVYVAADHPVLDKSVVFSMRRRDVDEIVAEVRKCSLRVAALRIAVAAQLELWLATEGEGGLGRDLLLSDGLSALLLNTDQRDFVLPRGALEVEQPRQAVQRPNGVEQDIVRFVAANAQRPVTFLGPEELCAAVKKEVPDADIVRPPVHPAHDLERVVLHPEVRHDFNYEGCEVRRALPRTWRRFGFGYAAAALVLIGVTIFNGAYALRAGIESFRVERVIAQQQAECETDSQAAARIAAEYGEAAMLKGWIASGFHAQLFCFRLLRDIPPNAAIDRLLVELKDGQISLTFTVLGDQEAQLGARRAIERAVTELKYKIGGEDAPLAVGSAMRGVQYRLHIIVPDPGEIAPL
jgi:hypothetical protein